MPVILTRETINRFQQTILQYYNTHGRRFPWRETDDAYRILVSEIMLQQTQTERVAVKYREWMERFPTVQAAAEASSTPEGLCAMVSEYLAVVSKYLPHSACVAVISSHPVPNIVTVPVRASIVATLSPLESDIS